MTEVKDPQSHGEAETRLTDRSARELLYSLTTVRGAATTLSRNSTSLSPEQQAQLLGIVDDESAQAIEILRRMIESRGEPREVGAAAGRRDARGRG